MTDPADMGRVLDATGYPRVGRANEASSAVTHGV